MIKNLIKAIHIHRIRAKQARHRKYLARLFHSGKTMRSHKTQAIVTDDGIIVDYIDGRHVTQRYVTPNFIRPFGLSKRRF